MVSPEDMCSIIQTEQMYLYIWEHTHHATTVKKIGHEFERDQ